MRLSKKVFFVKAGYDVPTLSCGFENTFVDTTGFVVNALVAKAC